MRLQLRRISISIFLLCITSLMIFILSESVNEQTKMLTAYLEVQTCQQPLFINLKSYQKFDSVITYDRDDNKIAYIARNFIQQKNINVTTVSTKSASSTCAFLDKIKFFKIVMWLQFVKNRIFVSYPGVGHVASATMNALSNTLLRNFTNSATSDISIVNQPCGIKDKCNMKSNEFKRRVTDYMFYLLFTGALLGIMLSFIPFVVKERISGFKLQQFLTGVSPTLYIITNLIFDYIIYLTFIAIYLIIIRIFSGDIITRSQSLINFFVLLVIILALHGLSGILISYLLSCFITNIALGGCMFFVICLTQTVVAVLIIEHSFSSFHSFKFSMSIFSINPLFATIVAINDLFDAVTIKYMCITCQDIEACNAISSLFDTLDETRDENILIFLKFLVYDFILYLIILLSVENRLMRKIQLKFFHKPRAETFGVYSVTDEDVQVEMNRIKNLSKSDNGDIVLKVDGIVKMYPFSMPLNNVNFTVSKGECFGLLGVTGAGKTTVLRILVGDIIPTCGHAEISNYNVLTQRRKYQQLVGYCPQNDALLDELTAEETLELICYLKGMPRWKVKREVKTMLWDTDLVDVSKKRIRTYSLSQKRKLNIAMAFIGDPLVVFLDEPTKRVNPESRRKIWNLINFHKSIGKAIVLSSHSTDECMALCNRITILKDGVMMCLGTSEYLKSKFSQGFMVLIKLNNTSIEEHQRLEEEIRLKFRCRDIIENNVYCIYFQVHELLSSLFSELRQIREKYNIIKSFTVSSTSLEQLLLPFVKMNTKPYSHYRL